jgi:hypothetical protein
MCVFEDVSSLKPGELRGRLPTDDACLEFPKETFRTTFTAVSLERCVPFAVVARGNKGGAATLRPTPYRDCAPL